MRVGQRSQDRHQRGERRADELREDRVREARLGGGRGGRAESKAENE